MHELSIARAVVQIAEEHADGRPVTSIWLRVGHLRQVVPRALELAFEIASRDTLVDGARLHIEHVAPSGDCRDCGARTQLGELPLRCAACGSLDVALVAGEELQVESIELDDTPVGVG
jgi:hydrogenase nickel incorporation protein HypA/HybF